MIVLDLPKEPYWIDLPHGVSVRVRPLTTAIYETAREKARRRTREIVDDIARVRAAGGAVDGIPDLSDPDAAAGFSQLVFAQGLAEAAIFEWKGVFLPDRATPAPVTPQAVSDLMMIHGQAEAFVVLYTRTHENLIIEGNASRPSPSGATAGAGTTAQAAGLSASPAPKAERGGTESSAPR